MDRAGLQQLLHKYLEGTASQQEVAFIEAYYAKAGEGALDGLDTTLMAQHREQILQSLTAAIEKDDASPGIPAPVHRIHRTHRVHFLRTAWFRYAAAVLIILGAGTYIYINNQKEKPSVTQTNPNPVQNDVAPGGNRATLTLADGSKIVLDSAKMGELAIEENATITKTADGNIVYDPNGKQVDRILFNTMSTPRGGQYQLTLPDGSQVWLNAESSITYPTAFSGKERKVTVTGEAYFEVTKNKSKPFRVDIGTATIEVLGTHFNINTYKEESTSNVTLLEGSVRIKAVNTSLILKPGQQGQFNPDQQKLSLAVNPDLEQVMAWKNGLFNFNSIKLKDAMRQLEKWYDVEVEYRNGIPDITFGGKMQRNLKLAQALRLLNAIGVTFKIEGKKLIVSE